MGKNRTRKLEQRAAAASAPVVRTPLDWKLFVIPVAVVAILLAGGFTLRSALSHSGASLTQGTSDRGRAPDFTAATVDGPRFSLATQRGRPVVLYFMAAWCASCLAESHALGQIQQKYGDRVRTVLVDVDGNVNSPGALRDFVHRSRGPSRYWVIDPHGTITRAYGVTALDTTYAIDQRGDIAYSNNRPLAYTTLDQIVGQVA